MDSKQFKQHRLDLDLRQKELAEVKKYIQLSIARTAKVKRNRKLIKAFMLRIEIRKK